MRNAAQTLIPVVVLIGLLTFLGYIFWDVSADPTPIINQVQLPNELKAKTLGDLSVGEEMKSTSTFIVVDSQGYCWVRAYGEPTEDGNALFKRTQDGFEVTLLKPHAWTYSMKDGLAFSKKNLIPITRLETSYGN
jgi:hypothetical protein